MYKRKGKKEIAKEILRIGSLKFGDFTLSSGKRSGFYLDLRRIPSRPDVYSIVLDAYKGMAEEVGLGGFDAIAGLATAGVVFSSPLAAMLRKPMVYLRSETKNHGLRRMMEGDIEPGSRVILVDDLVTTGKSLAEAATSLRREGFVVEHALVLVDRLEGGSSRLSALGVKLTSFTNAKEIASELLSLDMINRSQASAMTLPEVGELRAGVGRD